MSSQSYQPPQKIDDEEAVRKLEQAKSDAQWRRDNYFREILNGGPGGDRVINWNLMPRLNIWR